MHLGVEGGGLPDRGPCVTDCGVRQEFWRDSSEPAIRTSDLGVKKRHGEKCPHLLGTGDRCSASTQISSIFSCSISVFFLCRPLFASLPLQRWRGLGVGEATNQTRNPICMLSNTGREGKKVPSFRRNQIRELSVFSTLYPLTHSGDSTGKCWLTSCLSAAVNTLFIMHTYTHMHM